MPLQNPNNRKNCSAIFAMDMDGKFACRYKIQTTVKNALQFFPMDIHGKSACRYKTQTTGGIVLQFLQWIWTVNPHAVTNPKQP